MGAWAVARWAIGTSTHNNHLGDTHEHAWPCYDCLLLSCIHLLTSAEKKPHTKRVPAGPRGAFTLENVEMKTITAIPYDIIKEGLQ